MSVLAQQLLLGLLIGGLYGLAAAGLSLVFGVMKVLEGVSSRTGRPPEFFSTHPNPEHRIQRIEEDIKKYYPQGVPAGLEK